MARPRVGCPSGRILATVTPVDDDRLTGHRDRGASRAPSASRAPGASQDPSASQDRYGTDVLASGLHRRRAAVREVAAEPDLVIEETASGFCGAVVRVEHGTVTLEGRRASRVFPLGPGFLLEGEPVVLLAPRRRAAPAAPARTASGSIAVAGQRARVARAGRILVEGRHDAELVELVWGDDLRVEGVVVELLDGVDNLEAALAEIGPAARRRIGVLVDHLVPGSKEHRVAERVCSGPGGGHVLVVGHPFVDIWQAVKPGRLGLDAWPTVPRGVDWKHGMCAALGWPHADQADLAAAWRRIRSTVRDYTDLEPALLGPVERLIDFVTAADDATAG